MTLKDRVRQAIEQSDDPVTWDELVDSVQPSTENELDDVVEGLQRERIIRYNGREAGYMCETGRD